VTGVDLLTCAHDTKCIKHVNTPRIATDCIVAAMSTKANRLRGAREKAGFASASDAARAFGWTESAYRHHGNGTRNFGPDMAKRYGRAFKVKPGWLLALEKIDSPAVPTVSANDSLIVNGSVEAGAWRASEHWNDERAFVIEGMPSPFPEAERFGLEVVGDSMNRTYELGTVLDCISIFKGGVAPKSGDHVVVECVRPDGLRELTVKEYQHEDGRYLLVPRSTNPKHQPLEYPGPDAEHAGDSEVRVIAFVVSAYPPRTLDLMRRMGLIKPLST
jgi:phage repressor protein C with HTH and peptisase S24 domain